MSLIEKALAADVSELGKTFKIGDAYNGFDSIPAAVGTLITWFLWIAGILAFVYLVYAGVMYITANGNDEQAKKGQKGIINAVIGIIVITLAYTIILMVGKSLSSGPN